MPKKKRAKRAATRLTQKQRIEINIAVDLHMAQLDRTFPDHKWGDPDLDFKNLQWLNSHSDVVRCLRIEFAREMSQAGIRRRRAILHGIRQGDLGLEGGKYDRLRQALVPLPDGQNIAIGFSKLPEVRILLARSDANRRAIDTADDLLQDTFKPVVDALEADPQLTVDDFVGWEEPKPKLPSDLRPSA